MRLEEVKKDVSLEKRNIRINIRITNSQNKFVLNNNLSFTKIFDKALEQLGYVEPKMEDLNLDDHHVKDYYKKKYKKNKFKKSY